MQTQIESCEKCHGSGRITYTLPRPPGENDVFTAYCACPLGQIAAREDNPYQYPKCIEDPANGPEDLCGSESCDLHSIVWLESEGINHEQAVGLTAIYDYSLGYSSKVAEALGGLDEFNQLNENGLDDPASLGAWYAAHLPLVEYVLETREQDGLYHYWLQARIPTYHIPVYQELSIMVQEQDGVWSPYQIPGQPLILSNDWKEWQDQVDSDPMHKLPDGLQDPSYWDHRRVARFKFKPASL